MREWIKSDELINDVIKRLFIVRNYSNLIGKWGKIEKYYWKSLKSNGKL